MAGSIGLFEKDAYVSASSMNRPETEYWRIDLATGLSTKLPWTDTGGTLATENGFLLSQTRRSAVLVAGDMRVPLPNVAGHVNDDPKVLPVSRITTVSTDGRTVAGYQTVPQASDPQNVLHDVVAVIWRCQ